MGRIALFDTIHGLAILFELLFSFIYGTFSKKFLILVKVAVPK